MNEIVITLTEAEFDRLRTFLIDTYYNTQEEHARERVLQIANMVCHNADKLSLNWLDQKREEFA